MNKIRLQGLLFSVVTISVALFSVVLTPTSPSFSVPILTILIFFFGVPHGALDPIFAKKLLLLKNGWQWLMFVILYISISASVVLIWFYLPLVFMGSFLLISMIHFSRDLNGETPIVSRMLYGGSMIILPTLFNFMKMQELFSAILNESAGLQITSFLHLIAWPWLVASVISIYLMFVKEWLIGLEILSVSVLSTLAPPLVAFTVYFCGMHSLRHILRTKTYADMSFIKLGLISLVPMTGLVFITVFALLYSVEIPDHQQLLRFLFVGLAALTVPHMILIDRVQYAS